MPLRVCAYMYVLCVCVRASIWLCACVVIVCIPVCVRTCVHVSMGARVGIDTCVNTQARVRACTWGQPESA